MDGRTARTLETQRQITDAVIAIVAEHGVAAVTYEAVAERSGASLRTVYRHFPDRTALLRSFDNATTERLDLGAWPTTADELTEFVHRVYAAFDTEADLMIASVSSAEARAHRLPGQKERAQAVAAAVPQLQDLDDDQRRRAAAVLDLLVSAAAWRRMRELHDLTGAEAGAAVAWAVRTLTDALPDLADHPPRRNS